jgi:hypothetical protein
MKVLYKRGLILILLFLIVYFGFVRNGFAILTGIGTPYSYFEAQKATKNRTLIFYEQELINPLSPYINYDSLQRLYGFKWEYGGTEVSYSVIKLYNSIIEKELRHRLGKRWDEYQQKINSLSKTRNFKIQRPPNWKK